MRPVYIPKAIKKYISNNLTKEEMCRDAATAYKLLYKGEPEISVVMPAYNEADNILPALSSLCHNKTSRRVEIIVSNNNSKDATEALVLACGVKCVNESRQGISFARDAGMNAATGKYILNADADTIYPEDWIEEMVKPLIEYDTIVMTYGSFGLIPTASTGRVTYFFYEYLAELSRWYSKKVKDEAVNVYGFTSAFRKEQALQVEGFNHPPGTIEDGWMALKLRNKGFGRLHYVKSLKALVWTTDRRIQIDGGVWKALWLRVKRVLLP